VVDEMAAWKERMLADMKVGHWVIPMVVQKVCLKVVLMACE
jgi:hypothetical protein